MYETPSFKKDSSKAVKYAENLGFAANKGTPSPRQLNLVNSYIKGINEGKKTKEVAEAAGYNVSNGFRELKSKNVSELLQHYLPNDFIISETLNNIKHAKKGNKTAQLRLASEITGLISSGNKTNILNITKDEVSNYSDNNLEEMAQKVANMILLKQLENGKKDELEASAKA
jgi:hypothetical protein